MKSSLVLFLMLAMAHASSIMGEKEAIEAYSPNQSLEQADGEMDNQVAVLQDDFWQDLHRRAQTATPTYFKFDVSISPSLELDWRLCRAADRVSLDQDMYRALTNYGLGQAAVDFKAVFSPNVCADRLAWLAAFLGFTWSGGVGCRLCTTDNRDRNLRGLQQNPLLTPFATAFKTVILTNVAPKHKNCLGISPSVTVNVFEVTLAELNRCPLTDIPWLQTVTNYLPPCRSCNTIDFSQNGLGVKVLPGTYVSTLWKAGYGFTVTASATTGGYYPSGQARVFDTIQPTLNGAKGQMDLGSPNEGCGGIGRGLGGRPGAPGENCVSLGSK
jgi:hypothetical protein